MTILATDSFDRADAADLGANWAQQNGLSDHWKIVSNAAKPETFAADAMSTYTAGSFPADQYSKGIIGVISGNADQSGGGVAVRCSTSAKTWYWLVVNDGGSNNVTIAKTVATSYTLLAQGTSGYVAGDEIELDVQGTSLIALRNGVQVLTAIDASIATGQPDVAYSSSITDFSLLNWEGGDFLSPAQLGAGAP